MAFTLGEYQDIFLEEADEQLQELNQNLLHLEKNPDSSDIINNIFRAAHSLKSSAAFVGLNDLSDLAHKMENLLQGIRDKSMVASRDVVNVLFKCFDVISSVIETVASGEAPTQDLSGIINEIQKIHEKAKSGRTETVVAETVSPVGIAPKTELDAEERRAIKRGLQSGMSCCEVTVYIEPSAHMKWIKAKLVLNNLEHISDIIKTIPQAESLNEDSVVDILKVILLTDSSIEEIRRACDVDLINRIDMKRISLSKKDDKLVLKFHDIETLAEDLDKPLPEAETETPEEKEKEATDQDFIRADLEKDDEETEKGEVEKAKGDKKTPILKTVKVSVDKLDLLLNNVGELVIANSGFYKLYEEMRKNNYDKSIINEFKNRMEQMSRIAKDLQSSIMKTRMVPIGQVFSRFNRLVRDLTIEFGKKVQLNVKGEETELDKKVIDAIGEPLLHLIRNAIDHGIEKPEERVNMNKPEMAVITLNAYQGGNQIFVEVSDDGRGLNVDSIKKKAITSGLATAEAVANMDNEDIYNFIFTPGFSTAELITDISGRGVGMNVVREIVSELNGNISIETEPGMGTRFVMSFPLTLAIIPAIMVKVRREMYAIPLSDVIETIKISNTDITTIEGHEVINLRGEILSLLRLNRFVRLKSALSADQKIPVVVVGYGNRKIGMIVDYLEGKQEIVIKSLEQNYKTVEGLAGASILGDGSICLILDISSMINKVIMEQDVISKEDRKRILEGQDIATRDEEEEEEEEYVSFQKREMMKTFERQALETEQRRGAETAKPSEEMRESAAEKRQKKWEEMEEEEEEGIYLDEEQLSKPDTTQKAERDLEDREESVEKAGISAEETTLPGEELAELEQESVIEGEKTKADVSETVSAQQEETGAVENDEEIEQRVKDALTKFRDELKENIQSAMEDTSSTSHALKELNITEDDLKRVQVMANIGITNAAESLSKILNKRIDLSIPDVKIMAIEKIPEAIGEVDYVYIGVYMPLVGDVKGTILFSLKEESGYDLIDMMYGTETGKTKELNEDGESALKEVTNIIGSSVINIYSEKTSLAFKPSVPTIVHDFMQATLDSILVMHNIHNDYALIMDTEFYYRDDRVIGNLLILPETDSLNRIVERLRD